MPGFAEWDLDVPDGVRIHGRSGGTGPATVLLHGHLRAQITWHAPVESGHHMAEENPEQLASVISDFRRTVA